MDLSHTIRSLLMSRSYLRPDFQSGVLPSGHLTTNLNAFLISHFTATYPSELTFLYLFTLIISYLVESIKHEAPHHAIASILLLFPLF
jgi:hypothetical protein